MMLKKLAVLTFVFAYSCFVFVTPVEAKDISELTQSEVSQAASEYQSFSSDGIITHLLSEVTLDPKGNATITENIVVFFPALRHGIFRWIPNYVMVDGKRLNQPVTIQSVSYYRLPETMSSSQKIEKSSYSKSNEGAGYTVLKIGEADVSIMGAYVYEITYTMKNAIRIQKGYQELYLNVTGDQWELPILYSKAVVSPARSALDSACYTGPTGSTESNCTKTINGNLYAFASAIPSGSELYSMTVAVKYPENTFSGPSALERFIEQAITYGPLLFLGFAIIYAYSSWDKYGKDRRVSAVPPVFVPTKELKEGNLSTFRSLLAMNPKKTDTLAELIKIAQKGLLTIKYEAKDVFLTISDAQKVKLQEYLLTQPEYIQTLISTLTDNLSPETNIKALKSVHSDMERMNREADMTFTSSSLVDTVSSKKRVTFIVLSVFSFIATFVSVFIFADSDTIRALTWAGSALGAAIAFTIAAVGMLKRTREGDALFLDLLGLKKYIRTAELKRLEFFNNPKKMIAHFEELLPFAVILGLDKQWTRSFGPILEQLKYAPTWIQSDVPLYHALPRTYAAMASSMNSYVTKISTPPQSSGSSFGGGGGGFSGGGSGGGGGGSW